MTRTTKPLLAARAAASLLMTVATAAAQPPGPPDGGPPPEFRDPLRRALDADHDYELDADEIAKAPQTLATLDKDGDGRIGRQEFRPPLGPPPGGPGGGPGEHGFERPRRPGEPGGRPPREGRDGPPPRGDGPPPPREEGGFGEGPPPPRDGFRPGGGPTGDRPSPERFLERAKSFDTDGDGKLDESELRALAESMAERMRGRGQGGPGGGSPRDGGERPARPRRPE